MLSAGATLALVFARPAAFALALLIFPIVLLYFLRMRFRRKEVGSTFIWRTLVQATTGGKKLKRRSILLLLLQIAAVLAAAAAAAGPSLVSSRVLVPGVAILIDLSASMAKRDCPSSLDSGPEANETSRVEAAVRAAIAEIDGLEADVPIAVFGCADTARPLMAKMGPNKAAAKAALRGLVSSRASPALFAAFDEASCAASIAAVLAAEEGAWSAVVYTDGGLSLGGQRLAAVFGDAVRFNIVGTRGGNLGVTGLRFEVSEEGSPRATFSLWNGDPSTRDAEVRLTRGGERLATVRATAVPGWSRAEFDLKGELEEGAYTLEVERGEGQAPGGSYYLAVSRPRNLTVLLVGRKNPFIVALLAHEGISYRSSPTFPDFLLPSRRDVRSEELVPDIVISDSAALPATQSATTSAEKPTGREAEARGDAKFALVVFGPPPPDAPFSAAGRVSGRIAAAEGSSAHPLARFIDWGESRAESSLTYTLKGDAVVLATIDGKPVVVAWERDGYRNLACGIDLARSDLGLKSAFPILLQNYLQWYAPRTDAQSLYTLSVGDKVRRLEDVSFKIRSDSVETERSGPAVFLTPKEAGIFQWETAGDRGYLAVNVPPGELDVAPRFLAPRATKQAGSEEPGASSAAQAALPRESSLELGGAVSALFAVLLVAEWILWHGSSKRRPHPKKARNDT